MQAATQAAAQQAAAHPRRSVFEGWVEQLQMRLLHIGRKRLHLTHGIQQQSARAS